MSSIVVAGDTSGTVTLQAPAIAGSTTLTLPATSGTVLTSASGQTITSPIFAGTPTGVGVLTSGTAQASTSGTFIDFTGIPSWVKRITVLYSNISTNGTSNIQVQIGAGSVTTSGYNSTASYAGTTSTFGYASTGFLLNEVGTATAAYTHSGILQLSLLGSNIWIASGTTGGNATAQVTSACAGSSPALSGALDRVRITTVNGVDAFDAGSINILYE